MIVIADTSPINFLILIGEQDLLPVLFGEVFLPRAVLQELQVAATPVKVRQWIEKKPDWIQIKKPSLPPDAGLVNLDEGEREAIQLANELKADLLTVDEKAARREAVKRNLRTSGTLGILDLAADRGLIDFSQALQKLKRTSFHMSASVEKFFLSREATRNQR